MAKAKTLVLTPDATAALRDEVVRALQDGAVALLPTETVYARVTRADDPAAVARLGGESAPGRLERLVASADVAAAAGAHLSTPARRLARRYWPGPLTLVLDTAAGPVAFRVPGHELVRQVVAAAPFPLVAAGDQVDFAAALEADGDAADLAVDGGATALGAPSTVVRAPRAGPLELLREGFLDAGPIERVANRLIVFGCTGNTCRSPMAEAIARALVEREDPSPVRTIVRSAGTGGDGAPATPEAVETMRRRGIDLSGHRSRALTRDLIASADVIYVMTSRHARVVLGIDPRAAERVQLLDPEGADVEDPIGSPLDEYERVASNLERMIAERLKELDA
jgi:protein-tyrosine phosphatase